MPLQKLVVNQANVHFPFKIGVLYVMMVL